MLPVIETDRLTKVYGRRHVGIEELDLEVREGEVFGLLGPNGAGKTTTIRLLLDFIHATSGGARVFGLDSRRGSMEVRQRTGYLPGEFITYSGLAAHDVFTYYESMRNSSATALRPLCERFELDPSRKVGELSRGNRQKVGLVQAYMSEPELLVLDEPTTGLDPLLQIEFQKLVHETKAAGRTQFISSHVLPEIEAICDRVGIIRQGRLVAVEKMEDLRARSLRTVTITFGSPVPAEEFSRLPGAQSVHVSGNVLTLTLTGDIDSVVKAAARHTVISFVSQSPSLEDIFMAYYSGEESRGTATTAAGNG